MIKTQQSLPHIELCTCGHQLSSEAMRCPYCGRVLRDTTDRDDIHVQQADEGAEPVVFMKVEAD